LFLLFWYFFCIFTHTRMHAPSPTISSGPDREAHPIAISVGDIIDHPGADILRAFPGKGTG
jgi:hypothetical protein